LGFDADSLSTSEHPLPRLPPAKGRAARLQSRRHSVGAKWPWARFAKSSDRLRVIEPDCLALQASPAIRLRWKPPAPLLCRSGALRRNLVWADRASPLLPK